MRKYLVGFIVGAILAVASTSGAIAYRAKHLVTAQYNTSNATITAIWNAADGVACDDVDTALGMTSGTCSTSVMAPCSEGTVLSLVCQADNKTDVAVNVAVDGNWTP